MPAAEHRKYRKDPRFFDGKLWYGDLPYDLPDDAQLFISHEVVIMGAKDTNDAIQAVKCDTTGRLDVVGVVPESQLPFEVEQANPTAGIWYPVLAETEYVRVISCAARCTWTVQTNPIDLRITIDGNAATASQTDPTSNTWYRPYVSSVGTSDTNRLLTGTTDYATRKPFFLEGRLISIDMRIGNTDAGTVSKVETRLWYAKW